MSKLFLFMAFFGTLIKRVDFFCLSVIIEWVKSKDNSEWLKSRKGR